MVCACRRRLRGMAQSAGTGGIRMESTSGIAGGNLAWVARSDELRPQPKAVRLQLCSGIQVFGQCL